MYVSVLNHNDLFYTVSSVHPNLKTSACAVYVLSFTSLSNLN